jgi:benzoate-CoA ligase
MSDHAPSRPRDPSRLNLAAALLDARVAEGAGSRPALFVDERVFTYAEVQDEANRVASVLEALGVGRGDRILIALPDGLPFVAAFFATLKLGAVVTMVNPVLPAADYGAYLVYTRAKVLLADGVLAARAADVIAAAPELAATLVVDDTAARTDGGGVPARFLSYGAHVRAATGCSRTADTAAGDDAVWLFTSGSTGRPRAAVHRHGDFMFSIDRYARGVLGYRPDDVALSVSKLYFGYATGMSLLFPFAVGAAAVLVPQRSTPERLFAAIAQRRPTLLATVPTTLSKMLAARLPGADLSCLRLAVSAGEALPAELGARWQEAFGVPIVEGLGSAEMFHIYVSNHPGDERLGSLGRTVPGYEVRVVRPDGGDAPDGDIGALWVRGGSAALRYEADPERTAQVFRSDGWVVTSDLVRRREGRFFYEGRSDDMLKVGGIYVSPIEVESVLLEHPAVVECAVVAYEDDAGLVKPKAVLVCRDGHVAEDVFGELASLAHRRLAAYKIPRRWEARPALPRNDRGKLLRGQLR